jgi:hypothetical protein
VIDRSALLARLDAIDALVRLLRADVQAMGDDDPIYYLAEIRKRYGWGRDGLLARERDGEIALVRGHRRQLGARRSELEKLQARPHAPTKPRRRKVETSTASYDDEVRAELRLLAGGAR